MKSLCASRRVLLPVTFLIFASSILFYSASHGKTAFASVPLGSWHSISTPDLGFAGTALNGFNAVTTISSTDAWAVGEYQYKYSLIEHWNGTTWTQQASPNPSSVNNFLYGVKALSATDVWAVGVYNFVDPTSGNYIPHSLILHTTDGGTTWTEDTADEENGVTLTAITADPAGDDAWAVGYGGTTRTITLHLVNGHFVDQTTSTGPFLQSVSEDSSTDVWAVGQNVVMHLDGTNWTQIPLYADQLPGAIDSNTLGIVAVSPNDVWIVGTSYTQTTQTGILNHWNGSSWLTTPLSVTIGVNSELDTVTADTAGDIWAGGVYDPSATTEPYNALIWRSADNGATWQQEPADAGSNDSDILGIVLGATPSNTWAVGQESAPGSGYQQPLAEQYSIGPTGSWITPPTNGFTVPAGTSMLLEAQASPAQPSSSIQHVDFAANWNGSWQTVCVTTSNTNTYGCSWNLTDTSGTPIPNGLILVEFTVYDSSGETFLSPVLQGTITPPQVQPQTSAVWAGYMVTGNQFTNVKGSWVQPAITCNTIFTSSAYFWVGIDGFLSSAKTLEQIGTAGECLHGKPIYFVWYEAVPDRPHVIFTGLQPGDHVQAAVSYQGNDNFKLSITLTDGVHTWTNPPTVVKRKGAARNSAEWVAEAPCQLNVPILGCIRNPWPQFGTVSFTDCSAGGISIANGPVVNEITMMYGLNHPKGQPSPLNANNTGFSVQWVHV